MKEHNVVRSKVIITDGVKVIARPGDLGVVGWVEMYAEIRPHVLLVSWELDRSLVAEEDVELVTDTPIRAYIPGEFSGFTNPNEREGK